MSSKIKNHQRGTGPEVATGYRRGDSWEQIVGPHADHEGRVFVIGPGLQIKWVGYQVFTRPGVLLRCSGCQWSWVIC